MASGELEASADLDVLMTPASAASWARRKVRDDSAISARIALRWLAERDELSVEVSVRAVQQQIPKRPERLRRGKHFLLSRQASSGSPPEQLNEQIVHRLEVVVDGVGKPRLAGDPSRTDSRVALLEHERLGGIEERRSRRRIVMWSSSACWHRCLLPRSPTSSRVIVSPGSLPEAIDRFDDVGEGTAKDVALGREDRSGWAASSKAKGSAGTATI